MANARPDRPTSFEGGAAEGEEDDDSNVDKSSSKEESLTSNNKQNGVPVRNVDRYGFMGGDQYTSPDEIPKVTLDIIRKREVKWVEMFENWEKWMTKRFKRVRARCRKGIPPSLRARAWQYLCGSKFLMDQNQGKFEEYLHKAGDPKWIDDIHKDLHRQFPLHEIFAMRGGHGQEDLFRILKAYTIHNPQDGYCQAQGPIAAVLLMHMPAEQAFWCLVSICEKYLPGYYSPGLEAVHIDGDVLFGLLKKSSPVIYKHLKKQKIEPILYMTEWFMCVFSRTLPWTAVLRVWDMFFCEGVKVMFRIALVLFKLTLGTPEKLAECPTLYETMEKLRHIPHEIIDGEFISKESLKLNVDEKDMEKEHQYQITKRRNLREKAQSSGKRNKTKTDTKKKKKEKQSETEQKEKKHDSNSHLTFRKLHNKLLMMKETRVENVTLETITKPVEDEHILLPTPPVSKNESPSPKKSQTNLEMEIAKKLAEEAFTAKMQQTMPPVSVEAEQFTSDTTGGLSSETKSQQAAQSVQLIAQTYSSDAPQLPVSVTERPLLESAVSIGENQLEESNRHSTDGNQQQPSSLSEDQGMKPQLHFADTHTATVVQHMHSYHSKGKKAEINQIDLAVELEPGQLLTLPTSKIQTRRAQSPSSEDEHPYSEKQLDSQLNPDIPRDYSSFITDATPPARSQSQSPTPSGHLICGSVNDPIFSHKTQHLNHTAASLIESQDVAESVSSGEDLESFFVNPLSIEPDTVEEEQQIQQFVADDIQNDTSHAKQQQVGYFDDQKPNKDLTAETISGIPQQVLPVSLDTVSDEIQPQLQSTVEQPMPTKQPDVAALHRVNMHIVLEPNKSTTDNKTETPKLRLQNQKFTTEPVIVKSQKVLHHSKKRKPKHSLAAGQQTLSSRPLSTEIVKIKPKKLSSNLQMAASSISPESLKTASIVVKKQSVPLLKQLAVECLLVKTQVPLQAAEAMTARLKQLSLSAFEVSSSHLDLVPPKEYPRSEEKQPLHAPDTIEKDPKATADNLVDERRSEQMKESVDINQTNVNEHLVRQLSWQTVQHSNEDASVIPVEAEAGLPLNYDPVKMRESHI